jgi:acyl-CoA dehydrogenase
LDARVFRRDYLTAPIFRWAKTALPPLSETERDAIAAGDVWWDAQLFSGNPDWSVLLSTPPARLSEEERAFLDGPCEQLCDMLDDWRVNFELGDLPGEVWEFLRRERFFGMIIPKRYGGLEFSAYAHSEIIRRITTKSLTAAVTVMVPNSLGPGELLLQFGTDEQREHWLPRLADGREIPAFALTSEKAGSDAAAMTDTGTVCRGEWQGREVVGIRLNWAKRYITLAPVATVLGLAFKLRDPEGLLGGAEERGITCALIPTGLPGVEIGRRHIPSAQMFQNGPTRGHDVFVPLDHIIGGPDGAGRGWMMLMSALAAGRGISLPSLGAAAVAFSAHTASAYARIREQFGIPVSRFGGVQDCLGRLAAGAYALDAARALTCAGLDQGQKLAVISGIMKAHATYRMRDALDASMDVHAGKAVIDGPNNYLSNLHRAVPIGITVEGANILTRNLIIFGQGAIRCHPHLLDEMMALQEPDRARALDRFDRVFWAHVGHGLRTLGRAWGRAWTGGRFAPAPDAGAVTRHYRRLGRWSAAFALTADMALLTMGGGLKRREMISARLGDMLSELYILSATLKRWEDEGRQEADLPLVDHAAAEGFARIARSLDEVLANFPVRWAAWLLRIVTLPGGSHRGPSDRLTTRCAELISEPSATRDRVVGAIHVGCVGDALQRLGLAFRLVAETEPLRKRLRDAGRTLEEARHSGPLTADELARLDEAEQARAAVIAVDDFAPEEVTRRLTRRHAPQERQQAAE